MEMSNAAVGGFSPPAVLFSGRAFWPSKRGSFRSFPCPACMTKRLALSIPGRPRRKSCLFPVPSLISADLLSGLCQAFPSVPSHDIRQSFQISRPCFFFFPRSRDVFPAAHGPVPCFSNSAGSIPSPISTENISFFPHIPPTTRPREIM